MLINGDGDFCETQEHSSGFFLILQVENIAILMISLKFLYDNPLGALVTSLREKTGKGESKGIVLPAEKDPTLEADPLRASYVLSIPRAQWFRGVLLQGYLVQPTILKGLEDFEIRENDIFIITYPKSGTTWTEEIVSLIINDGNLEKVKNKLLIYRVEHLEVGRPLGHLRHLKSLKSPRILATHLPLPLIPKQLRQAKCKIIYVVRNPKDNAVSYYHHHRMSKFLGNYRGSWEEFLAHYLRGHVVYGSWFDHVLPYWKFKQEHPDKVLFIAFEELKMDLERMISRISTFIGRTLSPETVNTIANHCSFEQMKNNRMVNREYLPISDIFDMSATKFMRKGIVGDWKNYFTSEQDDVFRKLYEQRMKGSGLELVFEPEEVIERMSKYGRIIFEDSVDHQNNSTLVHDKEVPEKSKRTVSVEATVPCRTAFRAMPAFHPYTLADPLVLDMVNY